MAATPISERIREMVLLARLRAGIAAIVGAFTRIVTFGRAVGHAPGAGARLVSKGVRDAKEGANSRARSALSHRRAWLSAAWLISALSCALLFSVALNAPLPASLLVVGSVAIFSGLTAAITTNYSDRRDRRVGDAREHLVGLHEVGDARSATSASHSGPPAEILGGRAAH